MLKDIFSFGPGLPMLRFPFLPQTHFCFCSQNNLWAVPCVSRNISLLLPILLCCQSSVFTFLCLFLSAFVSHPVSFVAPALSVFSSRIFCHLLFVTYDGCIVVSSEFNCHLLFVTYDGLRHKNIMNY